MAAAEARAVWQRAVNRCVVQEDAKRAPKLACYQSNSTSKQVDPEQPSAASDGCDYHSSAFVPFNQRPPFRTLPSETRWWLRQEPGYGFPRCLTSQQLSAPDVESGVSKDPAGDPDCKSVDMTMVIDEASAINSISGDFKSKEMMESMDLVESYEMVEVCHVGSCGGSKKTDVYGLDLDDPWIGHGKSEPSWRTADGSELASFVAMKSSDHLENCDLPPPQKVQIGRRQSSPHGSLEHQEAARSFLDHRKAHGLKTFSNSYGTAPTQTSADSEEAVGRQWAADVVSPLQHGSSKSVSLSLWEGGGGIADLAPDKAQLLEALCHSQTRAREAEIAAKQALEEKEHVIQLFCRQASQLFAYKQWFQFLQLEATAPRRVSTVVPVLLPWVPFRGKRIRKRWNKGSRRGHGRRKQAKMHDVGKYAVVFVVGLGLVGAGLLLGWTVGWMLPLF